VTATSADGRRVGVVGGTFDPPHIGHLMVASEARWQLGLDEVRLVPAREPPHKPDRLPAPPEARVRWLERAIGGREGLVVSRAEIDRPGPSYTADTLERMAADEPGARWPTVSPRGGPTGWTYRRWRSRRR
jgi:nicotinate-nucleotide adenylyltransferase